MDAEEQVVAGIMRIAAAAREAFSPGLESLEWNPYAQDTFLTAESHTLSIKLVTQTIQLPISRERLEDSANALRPDVAALISSLADGFSRPAGI